MGRSCFVGVGSGLEASLHPWWIVSAKYGLVAPDEVIDPYDVRMARLPSADKARIAAQVGAALEGALGPLQGRVIEIHAGEEYVLAIGPSYAGVASSSPVPYRGFS